MPWGVILMVCGVTVLTSLLETTGGIDLFSSILARFSTQRSVTGMIAFVTGLVSVYSSTSGVVLPAFLPSVPGLIQKLGGGDPLAIALSILIGGHLVDVSPLSTIGALCVAGAAAAEDRRRLFNRLLAWGLSMAVVGASNLLRGIRAVRDLGGSLGMSEIVLLNEWPACVPTAVNSVLREVRQLQSAGRPLDSLMRGQPDTPTPAHIVEAAERALNDGRTGYPDNQGEPGLRRAVAERLARDHGLSYDPDREILITDGATQGLAVALAALVEPNDAVLLPDPIYDAYSGPITLCGGRAASIPATIDRGRFTFGRAELEGCDRSGVRAILINTPWNPVGTVLTPG